MFRRRPTSPPATAGFLGWYVWRCSVLRDRSSSGWAWLTEDDLVTALHDRGVVGAHLPGERLSLRDQIHLTVAVDPEGRVAVATSAPAAGGGPVPGPPVEDLLSDLMRGLRVVILDVEGRALAPNTWDRDMVEQTREGAVRLDPDTRQALAWRSRDEAPGRIWSSTGGFPVTTYRSQDWALAATPLPPPHLTQHIPHTRGMPTALASRCGEARELLLQPGLRRSDPPLFLSWYPRLIPLQPPGANDASLRLARWVASDRGARGARSSVQIPHRGVSEEALASLDRIQKAEGGDQFFAEACRVLDLPALLGDLAETRPGAPDPSQGSAAIPPDAPLEV